MQIVEFKHFGLTSYEQILLSMQNTVPDIVKDIAPQQVWFLEHESVYSKGTSAKEDELLSPIFPVVETGRGGKYTYHGPGQLICYVMIRLQDKDIKKYVHNLSGWIIAVLKEIGVHAFLDENYVGIWVMHNGHQKKIAAIGIRVTKWVTWHGFSLNINPDLEHFKGIIPCGIHHLGVTSLNELNIDVQINDVISLLKKNFNTFFK